MHVILLMRVEIEFVANYTLSCLLKRAPGRNYFLPGAELYSVGLFSVFEFHERSYERGSVVNDI